MTNDPKKTALGWIPQPHGHAYVADPNKQYPQPYGYDSTPHNPYAQHAAGTTPPAFHQEAPTVIDQSAAEQAYAHYYGHGPTLMQPQSALEPVVQQQQQQAAAIQQQYEAQQAAYAAQYYAQQQHAQAPAPYPQHAQQPQHAQPPQYAQQQQPQQPQYAQPDYQADYERQVQAYHAQQAHAQQQQYAQHNYFGQAAAAIQAQKEPSKKEKQPRPIANADATVGQSARVRFIKQTYLHLFGAILAFTALLWAFRNVEPLGKLLQPFVEFSLKGRWNWGVVLAAFMAVSWVADYFASHAKSRPAQYLGLGLYVLAEAVIFVPLLAVVQFRLGEHVGNEVVRDAAFITLGIFAVLTLAVLVTKKDFSFLRNALVLASGAALVLIAMSLIFGFHLGIIFSFAMVFLAGLYILFQTSQVLAHYDPESHVAAALALFSSVALMFWYVIRILMRLRES